MIQDHTRNISPVYCIYKYKENFVILQSIEIIAEKQGQSSTRAGILVHNLIPNSVY